MKEPDCDHAKIAEKPHFLYGKAFMDGWTQGARGIQPKSPPKLKGLALKAYLSGWSKGWTARENADKRTPAPSRPGGARF